MRHRRLLLIAPTTTYRLADFLEAAESLQVDVLIASNRCERLAVRWPNRRVIPVHLEKPRRAAGALVPRLQQRRIDAVLAADDAGVALAAYIAQALHLPGNVPKSIARTRNKYLFRKALAKAGLLSPHFTRLPTHLSPREALKKLDSPFPCVLKPLMLSGSRGVIRADTPEVFRTAFARVAALLNSRELRQKAEHTGTILVESYIPGAEYAVEGLLTEGRLDILTIFDKPDPLEGPYFEETIYVTPTRLSGPAQIEIRRSVSRACRALGLRHGPMHAEVRLNSDGVYLLEVAARTIGGLCSRALRFATDMSLETLVIRHSLGERLSAVVPSERASGVMMIPIPRGGRLQTVEGVEQARQVPGIEGIEITIQPGHLVVPLPEGASYLGFIFASGDSPAEVEARLRTAHAHLRFDIRPALEVRGN